MATLHDELLNDFGDSGSEGGVDESEDVQTEGGLGVGVKSKTNGDAMDADSESGGEDEDMENGDDVDGLEGDEDEAEAKIKVESMQLGGIKDVRSVASLMKSLDPVLEKIVHFQSLPPEKRTTNVGSVEDNPEYHLLTEANTLSTSIDNEIILVHKFIRDHYSARFPELETLITNPLDYAKAVAIIGNGPMKNVKELSQKTENIVGTSLKSVLDGPTLMVVTVEATTTRGVELSASELDTVLRACEMTLNLDKAKKTLSDYVQSRMNVFAPNLTSIIGSLTAAQLLNFAGGLKGLATMPSCNVPQVGSKKQTQTGFATNVGVRQQGFLFHSPIVQSIPNDLKKQAMRIVSGKLVLAARTDAVHSSPDGMLGERFRQECLDRLDKLTEAAPNHGTKALAVPGEKPARKRGGRRARKAKEATAMTDLRKAQNRMAFGKEEAEVGYGTGEGTAGLGMIGQENAGRIRAMQVDQRTRAKLSKKNPGWGGSTSKVSGAASSLRGFGQGSAGNVSTLRAHGLRTGGVGDASAGTASSIAFTPVQGLELVDPKAQRELVRKREADEDRWFKSGTFTQVGGSTDSGGFKIPKNPKINGAMGPPLSKSS